MGMIMTNYRYYTLVSLLIATTVAGLLTKQDIHSSTSSLGTYTEVLLWL